MEFFWLAGPDHKYGIRNLITVKVVYIDFYYAAKMNTGGTGSFWEAPLFLYKYFLPLPGVVKLEKEISGSKKLIFDNNAII